VAEQELYERWNAGSLLNVSQSALWGFHLTRNMTIVGTAFNEWGRWQIQLHAPSGNDRGADPNNPTGALPEQEVPNRRQMRHPPTRLCRKLKATRTFPFGVSTFNHSSFFTHTKIFTMSTWYFYFLYLFSYNTLSTEVATLKHHFSHCTLLCSLYSINVGRDNAIFQDLNSAHVSYTQREREHKFLSLYRRANR
jgi:hypothetical protein